MKVYNSTKKRVICTGCQKVSPYLGLMFQTPRPVVFSFGQPLIIRLHNIFVLGSTDVLFLLKGKVVEIKRNFLPFTFCTPTKRATHVIEMPAGMAKGVSVGNRITLR